MAAAASGKRRDVLADGNLARQDGTKAVTADGPTGDAVAKDVSWKDAVLQDGHLEDGHLEDGHLEDGHLEDGHLEDGPNFGASDADGTVSEDSR